MDPTSTAATRVSTPAVWRRRMVNVVTLTGRGPKDLICLRTRTDQIVWLENSLVDDLHERISNPEATWAQLATAALVEHAAERRVAPAPTRTRRHVWLVAALSAGVLAIATLAAWWFL